MKICIYIYKGKCTTYLEHHFFFSKGKVKLNFPNKDFILLLVPS